MDLSPCFHGKKVEGRFIFNFSKAIGPQMIRILFHDIFVKYFAFPLSQDPGLFVHTQGMFDKKSL